MKFKLKIKALWALLFSKDYLLLIDKEEYTDMYCSHDGDSPAIQAAMDEFNNLADQSDSTNILNNLN